MAKLIFGCGYLGRQVARMWLNRGEKVYAVTRSAERASSLAAEGIRPVVCDLLSGQSSPFPQGIRTVLFAVGYDRGCGQPIREVYAGGVARAVEWVPESVERFLYISSTGVYGNVTGQEVDEETPCQPTREGGVASLAAEGVLQDSRFGSRAGVLRLAGIYGPGRIPRAADLLAGKPIDAPSRGWLNLIHVEDAARVVLLAEERAVLPRTYVVSDGHPVVRGEYYGELSRQLGVPPPQFVEPPSGSPAAQRAASDKRVNPRRMFEELQPTLLYPSYREGLSAIVSQ
jgi:nucleoside-diphosphate-sugar epimerase